MNYEKPEVLPIGEAMVEIAGAKRPAAACDNLYDDMAMLYEQDPDE